MARSATSKADWRAGLPAEDQLCLLLARVRLDEPLRERAGRLLALPLRWDWILERAQTHGIFPLLYRNLEALRLAGVPPEVRRELKILYQMNVLWNSLLVQELTRVLRRLGEAGVAAIPFKGPALADSLYGDVNLRACVDLDLYVRPEAMPRLIACLSPMGYQTKFTEPFFLRHIVRNNLAYPWKREVGEHTFLLELHWNFEKPFWSEEATRNLWAEAHPQGFFGIPAYTFSAEWQLLCLVAHAAHHRWQGIKWFVDIHEMCVQGKVNWQRVREKAEYLGGDALLKRTLTTCEALLETPIPAGFRTRIPSSAANPFDLAFPIPERLDGIFRVRQLNAVPEKARFAAQRLFAVGWVDFEKVRLPHYLAFLHYVIRPVRLLCEVGRHLCLSAVGRGNHRAGK